MRGGFFGSYDWFPCESIRIDGHSDWPMRVSYRRFTAHDYASDQIGFRCARGGDANIDGDTDCDLPDGDTTEGDESDGDLDTIDGEKEIGGSDGDIEPDIDIEWDCTDRLTDDCDCSGLSIEVCEAHPVCWVIEGRPYDPVKECFGEMTPAGCTSADGCTTDAFTAASPEGECWHMYSGCLPDSGGWVKQMDEGVCEGKTYADDCK